MSRSLRIDVAYCVELDRVVDIQDACAEFFNQHEHERFHFLCSDETCRYSRDGGVRVSAINHWKVPKEQQMSPHYRELDPHADSCYWKELERALDEEDDSPVLIDEAEKARRRIARKVKRLITRFVIPTGSEESDGSKMTNEIDHIKKEPNPHRKRAALRQYAKGLGATATSLETLVTCFEELKELHELEQPLVIDGVGTLTFRQAFRQVSLGPISRFAVYYGGARLKDKRYGGIGFVLKFIDPLEGKPVTMYVSPDAIRNYRPSARMVKMMDEVAAHPDPKPYVRVYWIGGLDDGDKGWSATVQSLAHVVLRVVQPKAKSPDQETTADLLADPH